MGRRRRRGGKPKQRREGPGHNELNRGNKEARQRSKYLDLGREGHFKYDLEDMLTEGGVEEERVLSMRQMILTKAARNGIPDAKDFLAAKREEGMLDEDLEMKVRRLLDRYSTYR